MVDYSRYARQIALPELGARGQARLASVAFDLSELPPEASEIYLRAGGAAALGGSSLGLANLPTGGPCGALGSGAFAAVEAARRALDEPEREMPEALCERLVP